MSNVLHPLTEYLYNQPVTSQRELTSLNTSSKFKKLQNLDKPQKNFNENPLNFNYNSAYLELISLHLSKYHSFLNDDHFIQVYRMLGDLGLEHSDINAYHYNSTLDRMLGDYRKYLQFEDERVEELQGRIAKNENKGKKGLNRVNEETRQRLEATFEARFTEILELVYSFVRACYLAG